MQTLTPMMQQYREIKHSHQDSILMFRLGDFYEMFLEDAALASRELEIALTSREGGNGQRVPMCGVPFHAADGYIARLVDKGYKVAICEQMEDPAIAKGLVRREVTRVITPGTVVDMQMLEEKKHNFLASLVSGAGGFGLAVADVSTGDFRVTQVTGDGAQSLIINELSRLHPRECLLTELLQQDPVITGHLRGLETALSPRQDQSDPGEAYRLLTTHFDCDTLEGLGCEQLPLAVAAASMLLRFLQETQKIALTHLKHLVTYSINSFMVLDPSARRNLELTETLRSQSRKGSLLDVLDYTVTAMGGRLLRQWVEQPLMDCGLISERLEANEFLFKDYFLRTSLRQVLSGVYDLERLLVRVAYGHAHARDLLAMRQSLEVLPRVAELLDGVEVPALKSLRERLDMLADVVGLITSSIAEDAPLSVREGNILKTGYQAEVDRLREAARSGKDWIARLEAKEREETGIRSLKIGYNKVFGYYIEITRANLTQAPASYIRKQTLANAERYITPELKELETQVLGASERLTQLEYQLFVEIREQVAAATPRIQQTASVLAHLDVLAGLAECAVRHDFVRPVVHRGQRIVIQGGRHPVVERTLPGQWFVPNDTLLDDGGHRLLLITGPNMAGKSTYMRQVALIVLMAQIGCFVPAKSAEIGLVDRIFTRIGATDDLSTGQSTFMVEMLETAAILSQATSQSLIILDEVGRGTSTYDGMSIAQAVLEYLQSRVGAKTLFSTHYHELTALETTLPGIKNYTAAVKEEGSDVIFLRRVIPGKADRSYGINVARLSGLPAEVIRRAGLILASLEGVPSQTAATSETAETVTQLSLFPTVDVTGQQVLDELKSLDVMSITPLDAINRLYVLQRRLLS